MCLHKLVYRKYCYEMTWHASWMSWSKPSSLQQNYILFWYQYVHQNKEHKVPQANNVPNLKTHNADQRHYFVSWTTHTLESLGLNYVWSRVKHIESSCIYINIIHFYWLHFNTYLLLLKLFKYYILLNLLVKQIS